MGKEVEKERNNEINKKIYMGDLLNFNENKIY